MRNLCLSFLFSLFFFLNTSHALDLYAFGSYWDLDDSDSVNGGGVGLSVPVIFDSLRLDARIHLFEDVEYEDVDVELLPVDVGVQLHLFDEARLHPYILAGVSYIDADGERIDIDSEFGGYGGLGIDADIGVVRVFGEYVYRVSELDTDVRIGDELSLDGSTVNVGVKLHF